MASEAERKMAIAPGLLLVAVLLVAVSDLAEGKAAQMGGCYHQPSHWVHCNAWNSSMCPSDRSWMSLTASLATSAYNKPCTCATMDTGYCYSEITKVATCTPFENQCPVNETWSSAESVSSAGSKLCGTMDNAGSRWKDPGGCVRRIRGGESVLTQYGYCYSMTTRKATCALHAGYCQGDEKHYPSRTSTQPFDCPCHKVKVGACKRTKVCEMKCSASTHTYEAAGKACTTAADCAGETGKTACARGPCSVDARADGTIRCVVDADSCDVDEEYEASRSDDAADCTLCDEPATAVEPQATTPSPSVPIYTHQVKMSVKLPYSKADFDTAKQNTFKEAVVEAAAGSVIKTDVTLSNIVDSGVSSRRAGSVNFDISVKTYSKALAGTIASALTEENLNTILTAKGLEKTTIVSAASVTEISSLSTSVTSTGSVTSTATSSCLVSMSVATLVSFLTFPAI